MKYGENFEEESVPEWSIHNIDYNTLKDTIKTHTTKDQASAAAIAIPGNVDHGLKKFEDGFYLELCHQHDRVDLFVNNKAGELARRIDYLTSLVSRLILQTAAEEGGSPTVKQRRRFAKFQRQAAACGSDIKSLDRFVKAQVTGFRKLLKKYKKWTGSTEMNTRFKENILSSPKSFAKRDFHAIQFEYRKLQEMLRSVSPRFEGTSVDESSSDAYVQESPRRNSQQQPQHYRESSPSISISSDRRTPSLSIYAPPRQPPTSYWNEYEHGDEGGGDADDSYVIYVDPDYSDFPDFKAIKTAFMAPVDKVRRWMRRSHSGDGSDGTAETQTLVGSHSPIDYMSFGGSGPRPGTGATTDGDATDDETYASSDELSPNHDYETQYLAFPAIEAERKLQLYRSRMLSRATILAFVAAFALIVVAGILISTGRHKMHLEVEAGVMVGCVFSLFAACMGLGAMLAQKGQGHSQFHGQHSAVPTGPGGLAQGAVWAAFLAVCALNAMLLVLVAGTGSGL